MSSWRTALRAREVFTFVLRPCPIHVQKSCSEGGSTERFSLCSRCIFGLAPFSSMLTGKGSKCRRRIRVRPSGSNRRADVPSAGRVSVVDSLFCIPSLTSRISCAVHPLRSISRHLSDCAISPYSNVYPTSGKIAQPAIIVRPMFYLTHMYWLYIQHVCDGMRLFW
jgi:hypothetical protein